MTGLVFSNEQKLAYKNAFGTALTDASYPASGSFVDAGPAETVTILIFLGVIADALSFTVQCSDAVNGSLSNLDTTYAKHTIAADDDNEVISMHIESRKIPDNKRFLTVTVAGNSGSNYALILFLLDLDKKPVTQESTILPTTSQYVFAG